jgi:hypothetical protein
MGCRVAVISVLSKFRSPTTVNGRASQEVRFPALRRHCMIQDAISCDKVPRPASCGVLERLTETQAETNPDEDQPAIRRLWWQMAHCMDKGAPSNLLSPAWPKAGRYV